MRDTFDSDDAEWHDDEYGDLDESPHSGVGHTILRIVVLLVICSALLAVSVVAIVLFGGGR